MYKIIEYFVFMYRDIRMSKLRTVSGRYHFIYGVGVNERFIGDS